MHPHFTFRLLGAFLCTALSLNSVYASDKQLDAFKSTSQIFSGFVPGGAGSALSVTVDNSVGNYIEGGESVNITYTFQNTAGGFIELFRSYGTQTLDLSFMPQSLTLKLKGAVGNTDQVSIMLYEDNDRDGNTFETGEEVYQSTAQSVTSSWSTLTFNISSLTLFAANGGNNILDLDRIYAWRIKIHNTSGSTHSSQLWIDDLRFTATYTPFSSGSNILNGAFFQLWNSGAGCSCGQWTALEWETELQKLKDAGQTKIFIQYGVWETHAWYTPSSVGSTTSSALGRIFSAAESLGMKVVVGLYFAESWNAADKTASSTYSTLLTKDQQVADEIWSLFGSSSAFYGWYIPQEINDLEWPNGSAQLTLLKNWLRDVSDYVHAKDATKKVYIAPYFGPNMPADELETWYNTLLATATHIDVVMPQDGVGTTRIDADTDIPLYLNAIKNATLNQGRNFAVVIETFQQTDGWPVNGNSFAASPADVNRIKSQLWEAGDFTTELIQFEYPYMQGNRGTSYQQLYNDYLNYYTYTLSFVSSSNKISSVLYPVPCENVFYLNTTFSSGNVQVFDVVGNLRKEITITSGENVINISDLPVGCYIVIIKDQYSEKEEHLRVIRK